MRAPSQGQVDGQKVLLKDHASIGELDPPGQTYVAFLSDDTIRKLFLRFGMAEVQGFFEPMTQWIMGLPPARCLILQPSLVSADLELRKTRSRL